MAPFCDVCAHLTLERPANGPQGNTPITSVRHHHSLAELQSCSESGSCGVCHLFWTGISIRLTCDTLETYLQNIVPLPHGPQLILVIDWQNPSPESSSDPISHIHRWLCPSPTLRVQVGGDTITDITLAIFDIFAPSNSLAGTWLRGRDSTWSGADQERIITTMRWLERCVKLHPRCGGQAPMPMPTRVIDLGDPNTNVRPRLLVTNGSKGRYVALSYCWGVGRGIHKLKLKTETLQPFQLGIDEQSMTRAHREGAQIARELGYRYIWIDALCIIQGSDKMSRDDWAAESLRIPQVYGNAELTIVAGRSKDSRDGFIAPTYRPAASPASLQCQLPEPIGRSSDLWVGLKKSRMVGPTDQRAWCFQESVLSRRMISYNEEQLSFRCREREDHEDGDWSFHGKHDGWFDLIMNPTFPTLSEPVLTSWYRLSMEYSARSFFDPADNFAALAGVALQFQKAIALKHPDNTRYLAGLWEVDMVGGLLWRSSRIIDSNQEPLRYPIAVSGPLEGKKIMIAPSWSWMSLVGPIRQGNGEHDIHIMLENKHSICCFPANPDGKTWSPSDWQPGMVKHEDLPLPFPLHIKGYLRKLRRSHIPTSTWNGFSAWRYKRPHLDQVAVLLEVDDEPSISGAIVENPRPRIVALGQFDVEERSPAVTWALRLTEHEGLLLDQLDDGSFSRLGIFVITMVNHSKFESPALSLRTIVLV